MTTNTWFIGLKLLSVFSIGCIGSSMLYLPTFYKNVLNLGTDKIGFIYSITPFISCISFPFWTSYLDCTQAYKPIMITNMLIALVSLLFIGIVPTLTEDVWNTVILVSIGCFGWSWFGYPVIASFVDSVTFLILGDYKELYGRQKIGCPIGYGLSIFLAGMTTEMFGPYAFFGVYAFFTIAFLVTVIQLNFTPHKKPTMISSTSSVSRTNSQDSNHYGSFNDDNENNMDPIHIEDDDDDDDIIASNTIVSSDDNEMKLLEQQQQQLSIWYLLKNPDAVQFFLVMSLMGFSIAVVQAFLFIFMRNDLHASPGTIGLLGPLGSFPEAIGFFFAEQIHSRLGPKRMLLLAQFITIFRCLMYVISMGLGEFGILLSTLTQLLHGIGFSLTWSAAALQADRIAPKQLKNSAQGLLNMCFNGIGAGFGSLCGGLIYNSVGAEMMWLSVIGIMLFTVFIYTTNFIKKLIPASNYTPLK
ncbi:unnamed protein product [Cunninghamella blakesleeana]